MKVVIDTNVLVSGLLSSSGPPAGIVDLLFGGQLLLCHDARILSEYEFVLRRSRLRILVREVEALLLYIRSAGCPVVPEPLPEHLPDRGDEPFLEVALAAPAECLITGNLRHYPPAKRHGMTVLCPADFLRVYLHRP